MLIDSRATWSKVPLQDFTRQSDIDRAKSISDIDRQLYTKYGLDEKEIAFIEEKAKAMERCIPAHGKEANPSSNEC